MKITILLFLLVTVPLCAFSQPKFSAGSLPMRNDKIFFQAELKNLNLSKEAIKEKIKLYLENDFKPYSGYLAVDDDDKIICRTIDYIEHNATAIYIYGVFMKYNLVFEFADNTCTITAMNMSFMERGDYLRQEQYKVDPPRFKTAPPVVYSAEDMMIDRKYKVFFDKSASAKVTRMVVDRINSIIKDIYISFLISENNYE